MEDDPGSPGPQATGQHTRASATGRHTRGPATGQRSRRPAVALIALGSVLSMTAGIGWAATHTDPPTARAQTSIDGPVIPDTQAVEAILAGRARAVRERDRRAFLATVFTAPPAYQAAQRQLFDNLTRLPLGSWQEELESAAPVATGSGGVTLKVSLRYQLRGFDGGQVARTRYLTVGRRGGGDWSITGDGTAGGLRDETEIWDGGALTVVRGKSSLVIGDSTAGAGSTGAGSPSLRQIAGRLDAAVPSVIEVVGRGWARRAVALIPANAQRAAELIGQEQNLRDIAALAAVAPAPPDSRGSPSTRGEDRIVVSPATFAKLNALGQDVVLTHELTHVATGGARDGRTPIWLIEGLADYVGYKGVKVSVRSAARELGREVKAGRLPARLPARNDFGGESSRMPQAYEEAWLACRLIADHFGEDTLLRLYRAAGRQPEATALRQVLGLDVGGFTALWHAYLRKELR